MGPRPVFQVSRGARILIAGQAPGRRVHETGIPFNDRSGDRLRLWMGLSRETFYDARVVAIVPMGFCYPGTGRSGDLPPRPECAAAWRTRLLAELKAIEVILVIGQYAHSWHLAGPKKGTLTDTVKAWREFEPTIWPLPHPSPRNQIWLKKNPWFNEEVLPALRQRIAGVMSCSLGVESRDTTTQPPDETSRLRGSPGVSSALIRNIGKLDYANQ